jgi:hypothetical protein
MKKNWSKKNLVGYRNTPLSPWGLAIVDLHLIFADPDPAKNADGELR